LEREGEKSKTNPGPASRLINEKELLASTSSGRKKRRIKVEGKRRTKKVKKKKVTS